MAPLAARVPASVSAGMLREIQRALEAIYGVTAPLDVERILVEPAAMLGDRTRFGEELLVRSVDDTLEVGLCLGPDVLDRLPELSTDAPATFLGELLPAFAAAAEGVSHFVYLTVHALGDRRVSLVELEAQAEVDKFATGILHLWKQGARARSAQLRERLFHDVRYRGALTAEERERYGFANDLARGYTRFLESRFVLAGCLEGLLAELRRTWRLSRGDKFSRLACQG
ncbi:MAG TPA: hypothetical protein VGK67_24270 [Myxococcales bacterium]|jgi:hypothetical protein